MTIHQRRWVKMTQWLFAHASRQVTTTTLKVTFNSHRKHLINSLIGRSMTWFCQINLSMVTTRRVVVNTLHCAQSRLVQLSANKLNKFSKQFPIITHRMSATKLTTTSKTLVSSPCKSLQMELPSLSVKAFIRPSRIKLTRNLSIRPQCM